MSGSMTTLSVNPDSVVRGGQVEAAWSDIPSPADRDWIGLYEPGAPNTAYRSWMYTDGQPGGAVPFSIPASTPPRQYELRLFSNNGYTLLATSNRFAVLGVVVDPV